VNTTFAWLLKREFWETRAIWVAPAICAVTLVVTALAFGVQVGDLRILAEDPEARTKIAELGPDGLSRLGALLLCVVGLAFYVAATFTQFFYATDALYSDRRDRSVLFWKSLPVSDAETVLAKLATAAVVIPAVALAGALVAQLLVYAIVSIKLSGTGLLLPQYMWTPASWGPGIVATTYGTIAVMVWSVPVVAWLLFVSAVVPRSPVMWATFVPVVVSLAERVALGTRHVSHLLAERAFGALPAAFSGVAQEGFAIKIGESGHLPPSLFTMMRPVAFLTDAGTWGGLAVGAALVAAAIWARRYRDEST
jgi:ABC-2 type transport system permease protein